MKKKYIIILLLLLQLLFGFTYELNSQPGVIENQNAALSAFNPDITYEWEYHLADETTMAYGLYSPSNANDFESIPLILYLHGSGATAVYEENLKSVSLPGIWDWDEWNLENFTAYVLCPHLLEMDGSWRTVQATNNVSALLDFIIAKYNIDTDNIILCGESRGATGALYMAYAMPEYFSKCASFSAYYRGPYNYEMDTLCFSSWFADDAHKNASSWKSAFGEDRVFSLGCGHGSVGRYALLEDNGTFQRNWYTSEMVNLI